MQLEEIVVYFFFNDAAITNSTIVKGIKMTGGDGTSSGNSGGAILIRDGADPVIERCWITGNVAGTSTALGASGGGIHIQQSAPIIQNNLISANSASTNEGTAFGGGITILNADAIIRDNTILGNFASKRGTSTDFTLRLKAGGGIYIGSTFNGEISGNIIKNNVAAYRDNFFSGSYSYDSMGGGIYISNTCSGIIKNNILNGNHALYATSGSGGNPLGGAICDEGSSCDIINNTFYDNKLRNQNFYNYGSQAGQAIYVAGRSVTIKNNIFMNQSSTYGDGRAIYHQPSDGPITINYNCFYNNTNPNSDVVSNFEVTGNPLLTDVANGDFTLQPSSPCINTGDPTFMVPEGGEPRIDIGAFEFLTETPTTETNMNDTFDGNFVSGQAFAIAAASGTVDCTVQQHLSSPPNNDAGKPTVGRYWDIESSGNAFIRLYYPSSATAAFSGNPTIFHYTGANWEAIPTNSEETDGNSNYVESTNPVTNWSPFTVGDSNDPLPVELVCFNGIFDGENVVLNWQTATEVNNYGFEVERQYQVSSIEYQDSSWETVGFVQGSGTTNSPKEYSFTDDLNLNPNLNLTQVSYRLKQIDVAGTFNYSKIITVDLTSITKLDELINYEFSLEQNYPNPFNPSTSISYTIAQSGKVKLTIYDILAREITILVDEYKSAGSYKFDFNSSGLSSGTYFYKLESNGNIEVRKMMLIK